MSVPDQFAEVDRPSTCEVEYLDYNGNKKILKASVVNLLFHGQLRLLKNQNILIRLLLVRIATK